MKASKFVEIAKNIATKEKTLYIMGCFGAPMNAKNKKRYSNNYPYNRQASRTNKINSATSDTFGFDCIGLIKGILWGFNSNVNSTYGGASYCSNNVPDMNESTMINKYCTEVSTNFKNILVGELVYTTGHIGIYIGDNLVVESSPLWKDGVQITTISNIEPKKGYNSRKWISHGKCKFIEYDIKETISHDTTNEKFKVGDWVIPIKLINYSGKSLKQYDKKYQIMSINNDKVVLGAMRNNKLQIWATLNINNIKKV